MLEQTYYITETDWGLHVSNSENCLGDYETVTTSMRSIVEMCAKKGIRNILCESHKMAPMMSVIDLYRTAENLVQWKAMGMRIAYLMPEMVTDENSLFFQTVTQNRAVTISFFADEDRAIAWLRENLPNTTLPPTDG